MRERWGRRAGLALAALLATASLVCLDAAASTSTVLDFDTVYSAGWRVWGLLIGAAVLAVGAAVWAYFTAGAATPAVIAVGTWIGNLAGLTGIAATNYGLALLGGGAIASGGLGIAGGTAVLTGLFSFAVGITGDAIIDAAVMRRIDEHEFIKQAETFVQAPFPRADAGSPRYRAAITILHDDYDAEKSRVSDQNRAVLKRALGELPSHSDSADPAELNLRAIIHLYLDEYRPCVSSARKAIGTTEADAAISLNTVPVFVAALCEISLPETSAADASRMLPVFERAMALESKGDKRRLAPVFLAAFMDRYMNRDDILEGETFVRLAGSVLATEDKAIVHQSLLGLLTRYNYKLNEYGTFLKTADHVITGSPWKACGEQMADVVLGYRKYDSLLQANAALSTALLQADPATQYNVVTRIFYKSEIAEATKGLEDLRQSLKKHREASASVRKMLERIDDIRQSSICSSDTAPLSTY